MISIQNKLDSPQTRPGVNFAPPFHGDPAQSLGSDHGIDQSGDGAVWIDVMRRAIRPSSQTSSLIQGVTSGLPGARENWSHRSVQLSPGQRLNVSAESSRNDADGAGQAAHLNAAPQRAQAALAALAHANSEPLAVLKLLPS